MVAFWQLTELLLSGLVGAAFTLAFRDLWRRRVLLTGLQKELALNRELLQEEIERIEADDEEWNGTVRSLFHAEVYHAFRQSAPTHVPRLTKIEPNVPKLYQEFFRLNELPQETSETARADEEFRDEVLNDMKQIDDEVGMATEKLEREPVVFPQLRRS